jgi:hypothetical protein
VRVRATSVSVQKGTARIEGLELKESQKVRLRRLAPRAVAKPDGEVAIPVPGPAAGTPDVLVELLRELVPIKPIEA